MRVAGTVLDSVIEGERACRWGLWVRIEVDCCAARVSSKMQIIWSLRCLDCEATRYISAAVLPITGNHVAGAMVTMPSGLLKRKY